MTPTDPTLAEVVRRLEALEREEQLRDGVIRLNREQEVIEHTEIRREIVDAFERTQSRLWTVLGGVMITVLGAGGLQVLLGAT